MIQQIVYADSLGQQRNFSLVDDSGTEFTSISTGNTCGQVNLEFVFESSPQFCRSTVSYTLSCYECDLTCVSYPGLSFELL